MTEAYRNFFEGQDCLEQAEKIEREAYQKGYENAKKEHPMSPLEAYKISQETGKVGLDLTRYIADQNKNML